MIFYHPQALHLNEYPQQKVHDVVTVVGSSLLLGLFAQVVIPLPFTPVPIALQPHVCLLLGALLGSKRGFFAVLLFLMEGAFGLPFFSKGNSGLAYLFGPTGGYLLSYPLIAYLTGFLLERIKNPRPIHALSAMTIGNIVLYIIGATWLSRFIGEKSALVCGVLPFLFGDCLKLLAATKCVQTLSKHLGKGKIRP